MHKQRDGRAKNHQPGTWSTDDYIRAWAMEQGHRTKTCIIPLQSLHDFWLAKIHFDKPDCPVERFIDHIGSMDCNVVRKLDDSWPVAANDAACNTAVPEALGTLEKRTCDAIRNF